MKILTITALIAVCVSLAGCGLICGEETTGAGVQGSLAVAPAPPVYRSYQLEK